MNFILTILFVLSSPNAFADESFETLHGEYRANCAKHQSDYMVGAFQHKTDFVMSGKLYVFPLGPKRYSFFLESLKGEIVHVGVASTIRNPNGLSGCLRYLENFRFPSFYYSVRTCQDGTMPSYYLSLGIDTVSDLKRMPCE
jgi:hypothetical protein